MAVYAVLCDILLALGMLVATIVAAGLLSYGAIRKAGW